MKEYPTKYINMGKDSLIDFCRENASKDLSGTAIILFITPSNFCFDTESSISENGNVSTNNSTVHALSLLSRFGDSLIINAEDIDEDIGDGMPAPRKVHFIAIDEFLKRNKDKGVFAVCDAGVARSGFVSWYLDMRNLNPRDWKNVGYDGSKGFRKTVEFKSDEMRAITTPMLTEIALEYLKE